MTCNVQISIWYTLNVPIQHIWSLQKLKMQTFVLATGLSKTVESKNFKHAHKHNGLVILWFKTTPYLSFIWKVVFLWSYRGHRATIWKKKWIPEDHYLKGVCKLPVSPPLTCSEQLTCLAATTQRLSIVHQTACSAAFCRLSFDTHTHPHTCTHILSIF